jgi:hypothetical protein
MFLCHGKADHLFRVTLSGAQASSAQERSRPE